ncbi:MAG: nucleotidyltransferase family protein [Deltaproteobacteria bacterium]|nr:nucleotidyltransferase family protein [Deltaproteobacteria bacterium]
MNKKKLHSLQIPENTTLKEAMQRLNDTSIQILLVVDKNAALKGTVSDGDIRRKLIKGLPFTDPVKKVMRRNYRFVSETDACKTEKAKAIMLATQVQQIPVLDDNKKVTDMFVWKAGFDKTTTATKRPPMPNPVVIMAGGTGTRLAPFTHILPKPLIPIGDKPIIQIIMEHFAAMGFENFILTLNHKKEYIKLFLNDSNLPYNISFVEEAKFLGTAGGLSLLSKKIKDTFFLTNCDTLLNIDYRDCLKWHKKNKNLLTIIGSHREITIPYGVLKLKDGELLKIDEKPNFDILINTGAYIIEPEIINMIKKNKRLDMNHLIEMIIKRHKVSVYPISEGWVDFGQWEEYKKSIKLLT